MEIAGCFSDAHEVTCDEDFQGGIEVGLEYANYAKLVDAADAAFLLEHYVNHLCPSLI